MKIKMEVEKIKFSESKNTPFYEELKLQVNSYFEQRGISRKANTAMRLKITFIVLLFLGSYLAILSNYFSLGWLLLFVILFGLSMGLLAFSIGHDASHNALFKNPDVNYIFSYSFNLVGVNRYIWDIKHNLSHHAFTNVPGYDMDIEQIRIARLVDHIPMRWYYRYQHIYVPFLYPFTTLYMIFVKDFQMMATRHFGNQTNIVHPRKEYVILIASKLFYITYSLIIPLLIVDLPTWQILAGFLILHVFLGIFTALILFPAHALEGMPFPKPDENGLINNNWVMHEIQTTTNYSPDSRILNFLSGGLNTHIIHHVFPGICHIHYYELTKILRKVAANHNITLHEHSLSVAIKDHLRHLKTMAHQNSPNNYQLKTE
jgi:linoleoyl-CoA desaturase